MDNDLEKIINNFVETYSGMLKRFRPCRPGGEFLEQTLITLLSHEFLKINPNGIAYTEVPFLKLDGSGKWGPRLDCYLATNDEAILIEVKGSRSKGEHFNAIEEDVIRIKSKELKEGFKQMAQGGTGRNYNLPEIAKGLIIADCWCKETAESWKNNKSLASTYPNLSQLSTKSYFVHKFGSWSYYILVGHINESVW